MSNRDRDRDALRALAAQWRELAEQPIMAERRRAWTALKDLRAERPMVLFETWTLEDYLDDVTLVCEDPFLRGIEWTMRWTLRQAEEVGDDLVLEPKWRTGWHIGGTGCGVEVRSAHAADGTGHSHAYSFNHPIRTPEDLDQLVPRTWSVDRAASQRDAQRLDEVFGDLLPVTLHGCQGHAPGMTQEVFRLIGNDNLLMWCMDCPEALKRLMAYLRDDRLAYYDWLESEGLLGLNNHWTFVGSGSPGYVTELPAPGYAGTARLQDLWVWMESQETAMVSPAQFGDIFLPAMAEVAARFGLVYYGCCEPVHDRWDLIEAAMPHVRAVSISPWCDQNAIAARIGGSRVFSRKPRPAPISGPHPDWAAMERDLDETFAAFGRLNLEIVFRDVYRICGDRPRLRRWVDLVRARIEALQ
jgi:hypothetical protein